MVSPSLNTIVTFFWETKSGLLIWRSRVRNFSRGHSNYIHSGLPNWIFPFLDLILFWSYYNVFKFFSFQLDLLLLAAAGHPHLLHLWLFNVCTLQFLLHILSYYHHKFTINLHQLATFIAMLTMFTWFNLLFYTSPLTIVVPFLSIVLLQTGHF